MELQLPRGMRDFPPREKILRDKVISTLIGVFERYGFSPLETPILERWEVLSAKYAGGEEILKETYRLTDQAGRELGLRYDLTTPLARFIGMNPNIKRPFKRYHIGQVYRDGPVRQGRHREFYQCDVDTVGVRSPLTDAEFILLALDVFEELGFQVEVRVNHRELLKDLAIAAGVPDTHADTAILSIDKLEKIGKEGVLRELQDKGIETERAERWLRIVKVEGDSKSSVGDRERLAALHERVPDSRGARELSELFEFLTEDGRVRFTPSLARGLGYYTGPIFEVYSLEPPFDSAVAAGGRWDEMIGQFLGRDEPFPASGISFGLEPIMELVKSVMGAERQQTVTQVYVVPIGVQREGLETAQRLRWAGIAADLDLAGRGVSDNLKYANSYDIPYVLLIGPDELERNRLKLRDMGSGEEELLTPDEVIARLQPERRAA